MKTSRLNLTPTTDQVCICFSSVLNEITFFKCRSFLKSHYHSADGDGDDDNNNNNNMNLLNDLVHLFSVIKTDVIWFQ